MNVLALGLDHHRAPLDLRARLAVPAADLGQALQSLRRRLPPTACEATLLSTCNRTELYLAQPDDAGPAESVGEPPALMRPAVQWLAELGGLSAQMLAGHLQSRQGSEAARHAFRVASGLDSMVLGEPQILGQIKQAVRHAGLAGTLGPTLHQLFQRSFAVAKEVRTTTEIGTHSVSMAAATVRIATQLFEDMSRVRVLLVGAGEMIENVAAHLASRKPMSITLANRTLERGESLARRIGAAAMRLAELPDRLHEFDVVVSCTASSVPLIGLGAVERALKTRRRRPMLMVDLAVPRDIEPEVARLSDVYLYTVDDLATQVQAAGQRRQAAVEQAEAIVSAGVRGFTQWLEQRTAVPLIRALNDRAEDWQQVELNRARRALARGLDVDEVLQQLARGLSAKMMHGALAELHSFDDDRRGMTADVVSRLFLREDRRGILH